MRIIKRKKGNLEYFYLQHSYRDGNRVITKERYIGKEIPQNIEKIEEELKVDLYGKLAKIKENFQKEWQKYPESVKEKEKEQIAIAFTYNTNAIEGSTITLEDAQEIIHDKVSPKKSLRDVKETEAHSKVFLDMLAKREEMSNDLMLRWCKEIFGETKPDIAGKYRDYPVRVGNYRAPDWQDVKGLMNKLIQFINENKINPVELSAKAHYRFERVHPFGDGNGRIGRLLMNYILWHNKYPMLIIEYKKRRTYYKALQKDEEGFVSYFLRRYLAVHKKKK
ncbi:MAG: Fic family protein [Nanoarchaeota archaeon]|nr:Fic family protein [Nanoarchaeota archaeon]MBU1004985.1 Fic family protein [Nanoarchaeota archaeon]MBU1946248.1 Fic family protein [Nanoarchaeota archaeon]